MSAAAGRLNQALRKSLAMGPTVRTLLNQYKLDPNQISSSGPHQTLLKGDVLSYLNDNRPGNDPPQAAVSGASILSAPKPAVSRTTQHQLANHSVKQRYPRRTLTELEIEVINSGGLIEPPSPKQDGRPKKATR